MDTTGGPPPSPPHTVTDVIESLDEMEHRLNQIRRWALLIQDREGPYGTGSERPTDQG